ncbi:hypothetical protein C0J52_15903 [Blattella germanica]|nr:hypothetical protein C0J52_15903 [Blattella germanica]
MKINRTEDTISFLASRCGPAIESLCRKGMVIRSTESHGFDLYVQVTVGFCVDGNLNPQKYYKKLLHERFNSSTKSLDLSNFHKNQDDNNKCRYQLSSNAIQRQVFLCLRTNVQNVVSISVANNQISSLKGFALLCHLKSLYKLDLSQNLIINVNELSHLQTLQIKELLLNENPLCEKYVHEEAYIKLTQYMVQSRNLVLLSDYSKSVTKLRQGSQQVLEAVCQLPRTEHDPYSFKVDLIQCNPVVISVSGVFKEVAKTKVSLIRSFYRVFVLVKTGPKSYQIANETLHITNATTEQAEEAFRYPKPPPRISVDLNENDFKKEQMVQFMSELTMMNKKWSRKCLEETNWNIKEALTIFTELYKIDKIPEEAFTKDCTA